MISAMEERGEGFLVIQSMYTCYVALCFIEVLSASPVTFSVTSTTCFRTWQTNWMPCYRRRQLAEILPPVTSHPANHLPCAYQWHYSNHAQYFCEKGQSQVFTSVDALSVNQTFSTTLRFVVVVFLLFSKCTVVCMLYVVRLQLPVCTIERFGVQRTRIIVILHGRITEIVKIFKYIWLCFKPIWLCFKPF